MGGVGVGLAGGSAHLVGRGQQQEDGDPVTQLQHLLAVQAEVPRLATGGGGGGLGSLLGTLLGASDTKQMYALIALSASL